MYKKLLQAFGVSILLLICFVLYKTITNYKPFDNEFLTAHKAEYAKTAEYVLEKMEYPCLYKDWSSSDVCFPIDGLIIDDDSKKKELMFLSSLLDKLRIRLVQKKSGSVGFGLNYRMTTDSGEREIFIDYLTKEAKERIEKSEDQYIKQIIDEDLGLYIVGYDE